MHSGEHYVSGPDLTAAPGRAPRPPQHRATAGQQDRTGPAAHRWWVAAAWVAGGLALLAFLYRISLSYPQDSDGANSGLQAWDMLHGNLLLHGYIVGDATYYTFELPLYAITEFFFGLHSVTIHLGASLTYLIVAASAVALARVDSRGWSMAARCGVVIAVLAAPLLAPQGVYTLLELPDHTGTAAILLFSFLLIDRAPERRFTPPLLCAILIAGQLSDATVLYVAVPTVLVVCAYRVVVAIRGRTGVDLRAGDMAIAVAAAASVPLALVARAAIVHLGGFQMIAPHTQLAPIGQWAHNANIALQGLLTLFGVTSNGATLGAAGAAFGLACLLAAICGFGRVIWTWRTASRAEQLVCIAIVINIGIYVISSMPVAGNQREIVGVLACGAVLAARACVPSRLGGVRLVRVAVAAAAIVALVPLAAAATRPPVTPAAARLATWLEAHKLTYGLGGYWDASAVTVQSGGRVDVRALALMTHHGPIRFAAYDWETNATWYDPKQHDATFVIADRPHTYAVDNFTVAVIEQYLPGRPVATYRVAGHIILVYRTNLLEHVVPALPLNGTWN